MVDTGIITKINTINASDNPVAGTALRKNLSPPFSITVKTRTDYTPEFVTWDKVGDKANYDRKPTKNGDTFNIVRVVEKKMDGGNDMETWYITDNGKAVNDFYFDKFVFSTGTKQPTSISASSASSSSSATEITAPPAWTYVLPLIGLLGAGYYAHKKGGNYGKIALFAITGAWALSAPTMYYMSKGIQDSLKPKK